MKISYNWLQSYFKNKLPKPEKLAEILTLHSFETEVVSQAPGTRHQAPVLDVDVLPNRAHDCLSHIGIAREVGVITRLKAKGLIPTGRQEKPKIQAKNQKLDIKDFLDVEVWDKGLCPRYTAMVMTDVKVGPSPRWMKERLEAIGQKSINNIVDATNYIMFETGQPLHAFDIDKIASVNTRAKPKAKSQKPKLQAKNQKEIVIRRARSGEKIVTLEGGTFDLDDNVLVIADAKEPIAIAGIKGGKKAEITNETTNIILEAANFEPYNIRKTSRNLDLRTESSVRFGHGIDPNLAAGAMKKVIALIQDIAGGKVAQGFIDAYPTKVFPQKIELDLDYVKNLLGIEISPEEIKNILKRLGLKFYDVRSRNNRKIVAEVPTFRLDIGVPEDLIEEIVRIYGYEKIPVQIPSAILIPAKRNDNIYWQERLTDILRGAGFDEIINYSFIDDSLIGGLESLILELENPMSEDKKYLRPSLIPGLLRNVKNNQNFSSDARLFELGKIYGRGSKSRSKNQNFTEEKIIIAGALSQGEKSKGELFYEAKGVVDSFLEGFGLSDIWYDDFFPEFGRNYETSKFFSVKKSAQIKIGQDLIGWVGEISPVTLDAFGFKSRAAGFEIDFEKLIELASEEQIYQPISKYPEVVRDIAVLVPRDIKVEDVLNKMEAAGGNLIRDIDLFDIYDGEDLPTGRQDWPEGKKNLAFHIMLRAEDRTLISKEIDEVMAKIKWMLEQEEEWEVRR